MSDEETHFVNRVIANLLAKYNIKHMIAIAYHPHKKKKPKQSCPIERSKQSLEKIVDPSRRNWSLRLDYALWTHRTTFKALLSMSPYMIVFRKGCHLPLELEHKAFWALKRLNMNMEQTGQKRKL